MDFGGQTPIFDNYAPCITKGSYAQCVVQVHSVGSMCATRINFMPVRAMDSQFFVKERGDLNVRMVDK